jgi:hypothetical protein
MRQETLKGSQEQEQARHKERGALCCALARGVERWQLGPRAVVVPSQGGLMMPSRQP